MHFKLFDKILPKKMFTVFCSKSRNVFFMSIQTKNVLGTVRSVIQMTEIQLSNSIQEAPSFGIARSASRCGIRIKTFATSSVEEKILKENQTHNFRFYFRAKINLFWSIFRPKYIIIFLDQNSDFVLGLIWQAFILGPFHAYLIGANIKLFLSLHACTGWPRWTS